MSDIREHYIQAIYFKRHAWRMAMVIATFFFVAGFGTGLLWK